MMISYRHSKGAPRRRSVSLVVVSIVAIALVLLDLILAGRIHATAQSGASFLWGAVGNAVSALDQSGLVSSRRALEEENIALRTKLLSLQSLETTNAVLADENTALRTMLTVPRDEKTSVTVRVFSSIDASPYGTFVAGGGTKEGVTHGSWVVGPGGVMLGTVTDVGTDTSLVHMFLSAGTKTSGFVGAASAVTVTGKGGGNGVVLVPRDTPVVVGDIVYYIDHHMVVGVVGSIKSSPSDAEKTLYIRLPLNLYGLRFVTIIPAPL